MPVNISKIREVNIESDQHGVNRPVDGLETAYLRTAPAVNEPPWVAALSSEAAALRTQYHLLGDQARTLALGNGLPDRPGMLMATQAAQAVVAQDVLYRLRKNDPSGFQAVGFIPPPHKHDVQYLEDLVAAGPPSIVSRFRDSVGRR